MEASRSAESPGDDPDLEPDESGRRHWRHLESSWPHGSHARRDARAPHDAHAPRAAAFCPSFTGALPLLAASSLLGLAPSVWGWIVATAGVFAGAIALVIHEARHRASKDRVLARVTVDDRERFERLVFDDDRARPLMVVWIGAAALVAVAGTTVGLFGDGAPTLGGMLVASGVVFAALFIVANVAATVAATSRPETVLIRGLPMVRAVSWLLGPLIVAMVGLSRMVRRVLGLPPEPTGEEKFEADIRRVVELGSQQGWLDDEDKAIFEQLIDFRDTTASEVMTPRTDMVCVEDTDPLHEALRLAHEEGHSRVPVFHENRDQIVGIFNTRDLLAHHEAGYEGLTIAGLMRLPLFVPETKEIPELLTYLRAQKASIAIVLDEYGGTAGLVTTEDVLEELVGEIRDEFDEKEEASDLQRHGDGVFEVDAKMRIDDLNEQLDLSLPEEEDFDSLGGFLFFAFGKVPRADESIERHGARFTVLDADTRRVTRVRIELVPSQDTANL